MYHRMRRFDGPWLPAVATVFLVAAAVHTAAQSPAPSRQSPMRAAYMRVHFDKALQLHDAVMRGHLDAARVEAATLAHDSPTVAMPPGAEAFQGRVTQLAQGAATAKTLEDAAHATALILGTCGQCHRAMNVRAAVPITPEPVVGGLVGHMLMHQRGTDALVEGLVGPSNASWEEGVRMLAGQSFDLADAPRRLRTQMTRAEAQLAELVGRAAQADRTRDREAEYGRMLATCGACHGSAATHAGPGRH